jgi:thiamine biosynthesis lipoprotein
LTAARYVITLPPMFYTLRAMFRCRGGLSRDIRQLTAETAPAAGRVAIGLALLLCVPAAHAEWFKRVEDGVMGTRIVVEVWADEPALAGDAIGRVLDEMRRIDQSMSTYKPTSEVSQLNAHAGAAPVRVSEELFDLLATSLEYSRLTDGAFDITYASVGFMYDFRARKHPVEAEIAAALPAVNYRHLVLDPAARTVRYTDPGVRIDLGGIGKGHAVDRGVAMLLALGIRHALVTAGGDSRVIGDKRGRDWMVGVRDPDDETRVIERFPVSNRAFSTSGDYERYFDEDGTRYHHILDPKTGRSASRVRSATIIAPTATRTDGLSKTAFVLGAERALEIYEQLGDVDAILVTADRRLLYSRRLAAARTP